MNNSVDNIIIYNGENLPEDLKFSVTQSVKNLFNSCRCIYDIKIERSPNCIWYILSKNIPETIVLLLLQNAIRKAHNAILLQNTLIENPQILYNSIVNNININENNINMLYNGYIVLNNIGYVLAHAKPILPSEFDILD